MLNQIIRFFLENKLVAYLLIILLAGWGLATAPFDFGIPQLPRDPVSVDAIPDIGENQQIVFTEWQGRSPQDIEDQITYPLTTVLLGIPGVKSIRSNSMFGFSSIYIIFDESVPFYWSRSRILEKLNALPSNILPEGIQPSLGPDATGLGQIFWYTLEGRDTEGNATGGWDLQELRSIQDFYVRYGLLGAEGVAEVASIGGFVKEYQIDVDPEAMKRYAIALPEVMQGLQQSNIDVGAQTIEINLAEYFVRGLGYVENSEDIEASVLKVVNNVPVRIGDIARVQVAPASRRGILDKSGAEAVGGVVVARYGANPMEVIEAVKLKIEELTPGLATKQLADGTLSQVQIIPFYDRSELIKETIGTLEEALQLEIWITILVVIIMLLNIRASLLVAGSLPLAVLMCFIAMKYLGVEANIVALSGIAIAIGTMVDMGIVLTESMVRRLKEAPPGERLLETIYEATTEVASAILTALATTIISFLPVFTMEAAEGKLFRPLAYTKTFALIAAILVAITIIPPIAQHLFAFQQRKKLGAYVGNSLAIIAGVFLISYGRILPGVSLSLAGLIGFLHHFLQTNDQYKPYQSLGVWLNTLCYAFLVAWILTSIWMPLGVDQSVALNFCFVGIIAGGTLLFFYLIIHFYETILRFLLAYKLLFLALVGLIIFYGIQVFQRTGAEFMPALDEGSFLLMPTAMPHAGMQENHKNLRLLDMAVTAIPEVETVVGKAGRVDSPLDPAPMSMYENVILYKSEYKTDDKGQRIRYRFTDGEYQRDKKGELIPDDQGRYFRQWRDHIKSPDDIWEEIVRVTKIPGLTSAPKLQPIETRLVMLQTGMRAPMGIKVQGDDLGAIEAFGLKLEALLKKVEGVKTAAVFADRIVGKPYLLLDIDRDKISRHGLSVASVQQYIEAAIGGKKLSTTIEGRERYAIRVRYPRELRSDLASLEEIYVTTTMGQSIPLGEVVNIRYEQGPQSIKSEDGFLISYILFDREASYSEVEVVQKAQAYIDQQINQGSLVVPAGISYRFTGTYEQQLRANKRLAIVIPIALALILLILYFHFSSILISLMVFSGVLIAFAGGFLMIDLYNTSWFMDFHFMGSHMRDLFQIRTIHLSVAVWVGFLALFGIATDDGVLVATFLKDSFKRNQPTTIEGIRDAVVEGGLRRVRPAMMTTATTILALLPILTATGRGADIMLPMAIPSFGGMILQIITMFTVPVLYALWQEGRLDLAKRFSSGSKITTLLILTILGSSLPGTAQSLDSLLSLLPKQNPELLSLEKAYQADLARPEQVGQWSDPELGVGFFSSPIETRLGEQFFRLGVQQQLPWPGELQQQKELEAAKAAISNTHLAAQQYKLAYELREAYFSLYEIRESQSLLQATLTVLNTLEQLALSKVEEGEGSLAGVLKIQRQISELKKELLILEEAKGKPQITINQLLDRDLFTPIQIEGELDFTGLPFSKDRFKAIIQKHPDIQLFNQQKEVSRQSLLLNKIDGMPSFSVGVDYIIVQRRLDASPTGNGRDIIQWKAAVRLPLVRKKYQAKQQEEQLKMEAYGAGQKALFNRYWSAIELAYTEFEMIVLEKELYEELIQNIKATSRILEGAVQTGNASFSDLWQLEKELLDYQLELLKVKVKSHRIWSRMQLYL